MFKANSGRDGARRETRARKVSQRMAIVDENTREQAAKSRLEALENDNDEPANDFFGLDEEDDEFVMESSDEDTDMGRKSKKKKAGSKRKTRGQRSDNRGHRTFQRLLEESDLAASEGPNYLTSKAKPSTIAAARKFCSVCGLTAPYTCPRCGTRFCSRKCSTVHLETRCLKFMA